MRSKTVPCYNLWSSPFIGAACYKLFLLFYVKAGAGKKQGSF